MTHDSNEGGTDTERNEEPSERPCPDLNPHAPDQNTSVVQIRLVLRARVLIVRSGLRVVALGL